MANSSIVLSAGGPGRVVSPAAEADQELRVHAWSVATTPRERAIALALVCLFVAMRLQPWFSFNTSFDDVWSIEVARLGWSELLAFISNYDFHPPLFYLFLKVWMLVGGQSLRWLAVLPVVFSVLTLVPLFALFRELRLTAMEANLTLFLLAVNGYLIGYTRELRMYTLLLLLTVTSLLLFLRLCNAPRDRQAGLTAALAIVNLAALYTQVFAAFVIVTEMLFLYYWDRSKAYRFTAAMALVGLAFLPWAIAVLSAAATRPPSSGHIFFHIRRPDLFSVAFFYASLNGILSFARSTTVSVLLFGAPAIAWGVSLLLPSSVGRPDGRPAFLWLIAFAVFPVMIAFIASQLLPTAVWGQRHFIIASVAYLLLVAIAALRVRPQLASYGLVVCLVLWAGTAGAQAARSPYKQVGLDEIARHLAAVVPTTQTARLYVSNDDDGCVLGFLLNRSQMSHLDVALLQRASEPLDHVAGANVSLMARNRLAANRGPITPASPANLPLAVIADVKDLPDQQFWIVDDIDPPAPASTSVPLREELRRAGYQVDEAFTATAITRRWNVRHLGLFSVSRPVAHGPVRGGDR